MDLHVQRRSLSIPMNLQCIYILFFFFSHIGKNLRHLKDVYAEFDIKNVSVLTIWDPFFFFSQIQERKSMEARCSYLCFWQVSVPKFQDNYSFFMDSKQKKIKNPRERESFVGSQINHRNSSGKPKTTKSTDIYAWVKQKFKNPSKL